MIFVPGNHGDFARRCVTHSFGGVEVMEDCIHVTADGKRLWITHGDLFDGVIQCAKWLACTGDVACEFMLKPNRWFNRARARLGLPYWSLSRHVKLKVNRAVSCVGDFGAAVPTVSASGSRTAAPRCRTRWVCRRETVRVMAAASLCSSRASVAWAP